VHITNSKYRGGVNPKNGETIGGEEITHCRLAKGETTTPSW
jgi:hypothetical protein